MDALARAEELAERQGDAFITASVASFGSMAILALPTHVAAVQALARLDRLQPHLNNLAATLLSACLSLMRRAGDPAAPTLHAFLMGTPGCAQVARIVDPDLPDSEIDLAGYLRFDEVVALTRDALDRIASPGAET